MAAAGWVRSRTLVVAERQRWAVASCSGGEPAKGGGRVVVGGGVRRGIKEKKKKNRDYEN